jgi:uncharacterized OB-fold protein
MGHTLRKLDPYPRVRCPKCFSTEIDWQRIAPIGTVCACTITHRPTAPMLADQAV